MPFGKKVNTNHSNLFAFHAKFSVMWHQFLRLFTIQSQYYEIVLIVWQTTYYNIMWWCWPKSFFLRWSPISLGEIYQGPTHVTQEMPLSFSLRKCSFSPQKMPFAFKTKAIPPCNFSWWIWMNLRHSWESLSCLLVQRLHCILYLTIWNENQGFRSNFEVNAMGWLKVAHFYASDQVLTNSKQSRVICPEKISSTFRKSPICKQNGVMNGGFHLNLMLEKIANNG